MGEPPEPPARPERPHIVVPWRGSDLSYQGRASPQSKKTRTLDDPASHVARLTSDFSDAQELALERIAELPEQVQADGFALYVEGWSDEPGYDLALKSLDASGLRLLTVLPAGNSQPERALVWTPDAAAGTFLTKLERFATEGKNKALVANIASLRLAVLENFWQEDDPFPVSKEPRWWEVWFARLPDEPDPSVQIRDVCRELDLRLDEHTLAFADRVVALVHGETDQLGRLLTTNTVIAELHLPRRISELLDFDGETHQGLVEDLQGRLESARPESPAVCLLDTGVADGHRLLRQSVDETRSVLAGATGADVHGHGTRMAGLSLFGDLESPLLHNGMVTLRHRLESVKVVEPDRQDQSTEPDMYGATMAAAVSEVEIPRPLRPRVFSLPVSATNETNDGKPSSWSAALDALAFGTDVQPTETGVELLDRPNAKAARLFVVAAGNVQPEQRSEQFLEVCDTTRAQDPSQAWNVLTVGGYTNLTELPGNPLYDGCFPLAPQGELSPHSRTSVMWSTSWPIRPDIVLEAGNMVVDGSGGIFNADDLELVTTSRTGGLTTAHATSAATAQAARLAALALDRYPALWPETVRGLLVHSAEWTPRMAATVRAKKLGKQERVQLLRRYGWGAPTEERVLTSADQNVTMVVQDEFLPFEERGGTISMRALRLHELPWPQDQLMELAGADVRLRITLSYFVEPNPSNRGWKQYRYPSHLLRFDLKRPTETLSEFRNRVGRQAQQEEDNRGRGAGGSDMRAWLVGARGRNRGSLHADIWTGDAAELAQCGWVAVSPVGGWWKDNKRKDRAGLPIRYGLIVSLATDVATDIYSSIAAQVNIPTEIRV